MRSREQILVKLRQGERPFPHITPPQDHLHMVPLSDTSPEALYGRFVQEAEKAACVVHQVEDAEAAIATILAIVDGDAAPSISSTRLSRSGQAVSSWNPEHIPLPGLAEVLDAANITRVGQDATVRVGLTGVDVALAATGSLVVLSGNGRPRAASLLPPVHIAVVTASQILPDLESWWTAQKAAGLEQTRQHSNIVVITGPSRTADIAMQLVMGMHGPRELHIVLLSNQ